MDEGLLWVEGRAFSHYLSWECYRHSKEHVCRHDVIDANMHTLGDADEFDKACDQVISEWPRTTAVHLSNAASGRRAWLGRTACLMMNGSCEQCVTAAWFALSEIQRIAANRVADRKISEWSATCVKENCRRQSGQLALMFSVQQNRE